MLQRNGRRVIGENTITKDLIFFINALSTLGFCIYLQLVLHISPQTGRFNMNENILTQTIEIAKSNLQDYCNLDIVAFSFAYAGATGEAGGIYIIISESKLYHTNYKQCGLSSEEVYRLCPALKECVFNYFAIKAPDGWSAMYMGGGIFLVLRETLYKCVYDQINSLLPIELYEQWKKLSLMLLPMTNDILCNRL